MNSTAQTPPSHRDIDRETRIRTFIRRRRRFWRSVVLFVLALAVMVLLTLANRDTHRLRTYRNQAELVAEALQATADEHGELPLRLPELERVSTSLHQSYYFNLYYVGQSKWMNPVGVCCQNNLVRFYVRRDGRPLVLYDGEKFYAAWLTEDEFRSQAKSLGLGALLKD